MSTVTNTLQFAILLLAVILGNTSAAAEEDYPGARQAMVAAITPEVSATYRNLDLGQEDPAVLAALARVERHQFVPAGLRSQAYANRPLPIGHGQTISQPYIVALMTQMLGLGPGGRVLEIGTGSGYQAAVLAELAESVYSIEIIPPLGQQAEACLKRLGYENVKVRIGDGYYGWEEQAPFDAILVTAAASHIPPPLVRQLKSGGRMVIPVGSRFMVQQLVLVEKEQDGQVRTRQILPVLFVPLTGGPQALGKE